MRLADNGLADAVTVLMTTKKKQYVYFNSFRYQFKFFRFIYLLRKNAAKALLRK